MFSKQYLHGFNFKHYYAGSICWNTCRSYSTNCCSCNCYISGLSYADYNGKLAAWTCKYVITIPYLKIGNNLDNNFKTIWIIIFIVNSQIDWDDSEWSAYWSALHTKKYCENMCFSSTCILTQQFCYLLFFSITGKLLFYAGCILCSNFFFASCIIHQAKWTYVSAKIESVYGCKCNRYEYLLYPQPSK